MGLYLPLKFLMSKGQNVQVCDASKADKRLNAGHLLRTSYL